MIASCPAFERLAAAASGEDEEVLVHLDDCMDCQQIVEQQGAMRLLVSHAPAPHLGAAHREALAAEIMAHADFLPMGRRRVSPLVGAGLAIAAASAIALGVGTFGGPRERAEVAAIHTPAIEATPPPTVVPIVAMVEVAPAPALVSVERPARLEGSGEYTHDVRRDRDIVRLSSGELTVDATSRPVRVVTGDTSLAFRRARVKVVASKGVIAQVSVFAGSAEVTMNGTTHVIEAGVVWERPATAADSSTAFQEGWAALRDGKNADAIAAFDRAVDPMVAEDALYWGAIASERIGDSAGATQRYELLLEQFPTSPRARKVKKALSRLGR